MIAETHSHIYTIHTHRARERAGGRVGAGLGRCVAVVARTKGGSKALANRYRESPPLELER
jgi:hypothetical protein